MARQEPIPSRSKGDPDLFQPVRDERRRGRMRVAMGEVEDPGGHLRRGAVRGDVGEPHDDGRHGRRGGQVEHDRRHTQDLDRGRQRLGGIGGTERLVGAQVTGEAVGWPAGPPGQGSPRPDGRAVPVAVHPGRSLACAARVGLASFAPGTCLDQSTDERQRPAREPPLARDRGRVRVGGRRAPTSGECVREGLGFRIFALEPDDGRLIVGAVREPLEPAIEEAHEFMELVQVRPGCRR